VSVLTKEHTGSQYWNPVEREQSRKDWIREVVTSQQEKAGLSAVIGRWPGEETEEEFNTALASFFEKDG
jgi:hypothetical protein